MGGIVARKKTSTTRSAKTVGKARSSSSGVKHVYASRGLGSVRLKKKS